MSTRWASLRYLAVLLAVCQASPQAAKRSCAGAGTISVSAGFDDFHSSAILTYKLDQPNKISDAHVEVWDGPTLLFRTQAANQRSGRIVWSPKEGIPETPSALRLKIHVPENGGESYIATEYSRALIGRTGAVDGDPVPKLWNNTAILEEGGGPTSLTTEANDVSEQNTIILLMEEESADVWIAREYLPAALVDLGHVSVEIPGGYMAKPTRLRLEATRPEDTPDVPIGSQAHSGDFDFLTIYVMKKDRPVFSKIEPSEVSYDGGDFDPYGPDAVVHILGSGFSAESEVLTGFPGSGGYSMALKPILISSGELQIQIPSYLLRDAVYDDTPLRLWVRTGDDQHVSDPQLLNVLPARKYSVRPKQPRILAVSPYPVPMMDDRSGDGIWLKIYGENFTKDDGVTADHGGPPGLAPAGVLKTKFVSSQELSAWLPRDLWRSHRLSFRLVTQTSSGACTVEARQDQ